MFSKLCQKVDPSRSEYGFGYGVGGEGWTEKDGGHGNGSSLDEDAFLFFLGMIRCYFYSYKH